MNGSHAEQGKRLVIPDALKSQQAFLSQRQVHMVGEIGPGTQALVSLSIHFLNAVSAEPITLFINSPGGDAHSGFHIYDAVKGSKASVTGMVNGFCKSAAFVVLQGCPNRLAYPHAIFLFHPTSMGISADSVAKFKQSSEKMVRHAEGLDAQTLDIIAARSTCTRGWLADFIEKREEFRVEEAMQWGLLDEVVASPPR